MNLTNIGNYFIQMNNFQDIKDFFANVNITFDEDTFDIIYIKDDLIFLGIKNISTLKDKGEILIPESTPESIRVFDKLVNHVILSVMITRDYFFQNIFQKDNPRKQLEKFQKNRLVNRLIELENKHFDLSIYASLATVKDLSIIGEENMKYIQTLHPDDCASMDKYKDYRYELGFHNGVVTMCRLIQPYTLPLDSVDYDPDIEIVSTRESAIAIAEDDFPNFGH